MPKKPIKKELKNESLKSSIIIAFLILFISFSFFLAVYFYKNPIESNAEVKVERAMFGFDNYESYLSGRTKAQAKEHTKFVEDKLKENPNKIISSNQLVIEAWQEYGKNSTLALEKFNQAWLVDSENFNTYWGFGVFYGLFGDFDSSAKLFDLAIEKYDKKYSFNEADEYNLYCDASKTYIYKFSTAQGQTYALKTSKILNKAMSNTSFSEDTRSAYCYIVWSYAEYYLGNIENSKKIIEEFTLKHPQFKDDENVAKIKELLESQG